MCLRVCTFPVKGCVLFPLLKEVLSIKNHCFNPTCLSASRGICPDMLHACFHGGIHDLKLHFLSPQLALATLKHILHITLLISTSSHLLISFPRTLSLLVSGAVSTFPLQIQLMSFWFFPDPLLGSLYRLTTANPCSTSLYLCH